MRILVGTISGVLFGILTGTVLFTVATMAHP